MTVTIEDRAAHAERAFRLTGWKVLAIILAFFGTIGLANGIMIHFAVSTFSGLTTASPYEAGLAYNKDIAAARAQDGLHWQVAAHVARASNGKAHVSVNIQDGAQTPVAALRVTTRFQAPSDEKRDVEAVLTQIQPGIYGGDIALTGDNWDLVILADQQGKPIYRSQNRIHIE